ncbi:proton-conducting transporter transmembrane domain-containing protein [Thiohalorhabdus sp.]|uniref:proton-conducting transporter transmembrane domain-containing protein n=1 Tax=Thiohalorhabdus sp. TaxID=3094134 RepID=UPI002FC35B54
MTGLLPILAVALPGFAGLIIFFIPEGRHGLRTAVNLGAAGGKLGLVIVLLGAVALGAVAEVALPWLPGRPLALRTDALALLFLSLSSFLWLLTTLYAVAYLEGSPHRSRFFGFFSLSVAATAGIALAGNLVTFFFFYELLTLATYPLVAHRETAEARRAAAAYLRYTLAGGALLLLGIVWLEAAAGPVTFAPGGTIADNPEVAPAVAVATFGLMLAGVGVKAAMVPLHGWLPRAMVAPAPVSALLHAVAVVKAGAFGIVRLVYDVYGVGHAEVLGLLDILVVAATVTILWGSLRALAQDDLKRRLAYSTVSQVAYIGLGVAVAGPIATVGGIVHIIHQGLMKITLFFAAGNLAETLGIHRISRMDGVGRRMPLTMAAFTVSALGMIGVPPTAGFVTKWYLGLGALESGSVWVLAVLAASSGLNAAYFLPILQRAWFRPAVAGEWADHGSPGRLETHWLLLLPPAATAVTALVVGVAAGSPLSPLAWAELVAQRAYAP